MSVSKLKFVVYIPTYTDYKHAGLQAERLRTEFESTLLDLVVVISVNSVSLSQTDLTQLKNSCDKLIYFPENLGGDTNINLGFVSALREKADYFWILSANDTLIPGASRLVLKAVENLNSDLLIISPSSNPPGTLQNAFSGKSAQLPLGLISAVIYNCSIFRESFASSLKFSWTGWGQLSVIQNALFELKTLSYEVIDQACVYDRSTDSNSSEQLKRNQSNYRHSFFGYPLVVTLLFGSNKRIQNRIIRQWLWSNWYKIGFFRKGHSPYLATGETVKDAFWTETLAKPFIIRSGLLSPLLYILGNTSLISKMQHNSLLRLAKSRIYP